MAKTKAPKADLSKYPHSTSFLARSECIVHSFRECYAMLNRLSECAMPLIPPGDLRDALQSQIDEALENADIARKALSGDDGEGDDD